jgi:hypothetical protein
MLRQRQRAEHVIDLIHEAIYEGRPMGTSIESPALAHLRRQKSAPATLNVTRSMVDTLVARLCKRRPMPTLTADDAKWSQKMYGKRAARTLRRKLGRPDVERMKPDVLRDAAIRGTGCAKVVRCGGDVTYERIPRHELVVDPREARYGLASLPQMAHVKPYSQAKLRAEFPDCVEAINAAVGISTTDEWMPADYDAPTTTDRIDVAEGWYLPSAPDAGDGRHIIAIRGKALVDEPWTRPRFPVAFEYMSAPVRGVWGHGLVEDLAGIQAKINDTARDIQECLYYGGTLKIFAPRGSNVNKAHLRARHPVVIEHDGQAPTFVAPNPVSAQQLQFLEWLYQKAYEITGISQASAASKSALGSNASGKALDTQYDIESDRFAAVELGHAMFMCDLGQLTIDEAQAISADWKADKAERRKRKGKEATREGIEPAQWIQEIDWKKVRVDEGDYHLTIEPINFLPDSRSGKLAYVAELGKAGLISGKAQTMSLFDEPDMARANRYLLGPIRNIERMIEGICDVGTPMSDVMADPHMNLGLALEMVVGEYNNAQAEGVNDEDSGEEVQERFRLVIASIEETQKQVAAAKAAPPIGGPPPPGLDAQAGAPGLLPPPMQGDPSMPLAPMPPPMSTMPLPAPGMA